MNTVSLSPSGCCGNAQQPRAHLRGWQRMRKTDSYRAEEAHLYASCQQFSWFVMQLYTGTLKGNCSSPFKIIFSDLCLYAHQEQYYYNLHIKVKKIQGFMKRKGMEKTKCQSLGMGEGWLCLAVAWQPVAEDMREEGMSGFPINIFRKY